MWDRFLTRLLVLLILCAGNALSQEPPQSLDQNNEVDESEQSLNDKIDQLDIKIDKILISTTQNQSIFIDQPLGDRRHGIEFNFFRFIVMESESRSLTGGYSYFDTQRNVEFAFPFLLASSDHDFSCECGAVQPNWSEYGDDKLNALTQDFQYRKYLGHKLNGFFISGITRATLLDGTKNDGSKGSELKLGLGVGIGYRIISKSGLYWGVSLSGGRYLIGESDKFASSSGYLTENPDSENFLSIELLKFGVAF